MKSDEELNKARAEYLEAERQVINEETKAQERLAELKRQSAEEEAKAISVVQNSIAKAELEYSARIEALEKDAQESEASLLILSDITAEEAEKEAAEIRSKIAYLKKEFEDNTKRLETVYDDAIASLENRKFTEPTPVKGVWTTTEEYRRLIIDYDKRRQEFEETNNNTVNDLKLKKEQTFQELSLSVEKTILDSIAPLTERLKEHNVGRYISAKEEYAAISFGEKDIDNLKLPFTLKYDGKSYNFNYIFENIYEFRAMYETRNGFYAVPTFGIEPYQLEAKKFLSGFTVTHLGNDKKAWFRFALGERFSELSSEKFISIGGLLYIERANGKHYIWGNVGELTGAGNTDYITEPQEVNFSIKKSVEGKIVEYRLYNLLTYYVLTNKGLYAWGNNKYGQVGNGSSDWKVRTPQKIMSGQVNELITGRTVYAITDRGLYAWGNNEDEEVGNGSADETVSTPQKVMDGCVKKLVTGWTFYAITDVGLYAWGNNKYGQVGNGSADETVSTPQKIMDGCVKEIIFDLNDRYKSTVYAITDTGLYAWGSNYRGLVGNGSSDKVVSTPQKIMDGCVKKLVTGYTVYVITDDGLYAWGNNEDGQVGNGSSDEIVRTPQKIIDGCVKDIIFGLYYYGYDYVVYGSTVYAITDRGLYAWGDNEYGQVGNGLSDEVVFTPQKIMDEHVNELITGATVYAITDMGLYAWGNNKHGQVGNGLSDEVVRTPQKIIDACVRTVIQESIAEDVYVFYAVTDTGLYAWGDRYGHIGGNIPDEMVLTPQKIIDGCIKELITNDDTFYLITDAGLYAWGDNRFGQVGNGSAGYFAGVDTPQKIINGCVHDVIIDWDGRSSYLHGAVYAITDTGLYAWGINYHEDERYKNYLLSYPQEIIADCIKEVIIDDTVYAITENGELYTWKNNKYGELDNIVGTSGKVVWNPVKIKFSDKEKNNKNIEELNTESLTSEQKKQYFEIQAIGQKVKAEYHKAEQRRIDEETKTREQFAEFQTRFAEEEAIAVSTAQGSIAKAELESSAKIEEIKKIAQESEASLLILSDITAEEAEKEASEIRLKIAYLKKEFEDNTKRLETVYDDAIASLENRKFTEPVTVKREWTTTEEYNELKADYDKRKQEFETSKNNSVNNLNSKKEALQNIHLFVEETVLNSIAPLTERLKEHNAGRYISAKEKYAAISFGEKDVDNLKLPFALKYDGKSYNFDYVFENIPVFRAMYETRSRFYAVPTFGIEPYQSEAKKFLSGLTVTHIGSNKEVWFKVEAGKPFLESLAIKIISIGGLSYVEMPDGKRYIWGNVGELAGTGNTDCITEPQEVNFSIKETVEEKIDEECPHDLLTYYILTNKGLYAWGNNECGQVGNGSAADRVFYPQKVMDGCVNELITGDTVYAITDEGSYAWGDNKCGQVGNGSADERVSSPQKIINGGVKKLITGDTVFAITDTGLYAWGNNEYGRAGNGFADEIISSPQKVMDGYIKEVITRDSTVYVIMDKSLYAWGKNDCGQVGNGSADEMVSTPQKVMDGCVKDIIFGSCRYDGGEFVYDNTVYVIMDTGLYTWGDNEYGHVGNGSTDKVVSLPQKIIDGCVKKLITDDNTVYAITDAGLYAWGNNKYGRVGNGSANEIVSSPQKIIDGCVKKLITDDNTVYAITDAGLYAWCYHKYGRVVNDSSVWVVTPQKIIDDHVKELIITESSSKYYRAFEKTYYAITDDGLYAWGNNEYGQVGNDHASGVSPKKIINGCIKKLITDGDTVFAITNDGLYAWGNNEYGQVGSGAFRLTTSGDTVYAWTDKIDLTLIKRNKDYVMFDEGYAISIVSSPRKIINGYVKEVIIYGWTIYAITGTGLYVWGNDEYRQAGNGATKSIESSPQKIMDGYIKEVITGNRSVKAITKSGEIWEVYAGINKILG